MGGQVHLNAGMRWASRELMGVRVGGGMAWREAEARVSDELRACEKGGRRARVRDEEVATGAAAANDEESHA